MKNLQILTEESCSYAIYEKLGCKKIYETTVENKEYGKLGSILTEKHLYFVDKPCEKRNPCYPLDSISIMPECNEYFVDLTEEDRNRNKENYKEDDVIDFIVNNCSK